VLATKTTIVDLFRLARASHCYWRGKKHVQWRQQLDVVRDGARPEMSVAVKKKCVTVTSKLSLIHQRKFSLTTERKTVYNMQAYRLAIQFRRVNGDVCQISNLCDVITKDTLRSAKWQNSKFITQPLKHELCLVIISMRCQHVSTK